MKLKKIKNKAILFTLSAFYIMWTSRIVGFTGDTYWYLLITVGSSYTTHEHGDQASEHKSVKFEGWLHLHVHNVRSYSLKHKRVPLNVWKHADSSVQLTQFSLTWTMSRAYRWNYRIYEKQIIPYL